uniref:Uncharacterized protein n=1 Tax=Oryza punctata TaxID=4537 RepID=A0A0E0JN56_ORYPU
MPPYKISSMDAGATFHDEDASSSSSLQELWPVGEIDPKRARFPCCIVWTPLPVVSWLAPYIGHAGICQEDGTVLDFAGSNLVSMDNFAYGSIARYLQLDRKKVCMIPNIFHFFIWNGVHNSTYLIVAYSSKTATLIIIG